MKFEQPLIEGRLIRRYKRFLADVALGDDIHTAHCPNPGALMGLNLPGVQVWLSKAQNAKRKLPFTLELIAAASVSQPEKVLVGINTGLPNRLVEEAILNGTIGELQGYASLRREVRYGVNSRVDLLLEDGSGAPCYVEVKNVHLSRVSGHAEFPDCVTERGAKHLRELSEVVRQGHRAVLVYCIQRGDCDAFSLAADIDPGYASAAAQAKAAGVEMLAYACEVTFAGIALRRRLEMRA